MGTGALTMVFLLLAAGQAKEEPKEAMHTNQRNLKVPFVIKPERQKEISEIKLYMSSDKGRTWNPIASLAPSSEFFAFRAPEDGEYWLCSAAVDRLGKQQPENIYQIPAKDIWKLVIDTRKPTVNLVSAQRQGDEVVVAWEITEEHPDPNTLKLEYQVQGGPPIWTLVPVKPEPADKKSFKPSSSGPVTVRLTFQDKAGNVSTATAEVAGPGGITTAGFTNTPAAPPQMSPAPPPLPAAGDVRGSPPPVVDPPYRPTARTASDPVPPSANSSIAPPPPVGGASAFGSPSPDSRPIASTEMRQAAHTLATGQKALPPVQHVNNRRVTLEYEVSRVGPSGVGSVELWWTPDDGKTWERAPTPPAKDEQNDKRFLRTVELQEGDGIYGFALIVRSRAGLGRQPPKSGDVPEIRIELDTATPQAQLFMPKPDPLHQDALLLSWAARDKNLTANPISIEWAAQPEGPWKNIAGDQPNTGQFSWTLEAGMPVQVYLRLRVRDMAGNEGVVVTTEPQLVDLTEPEGRLVNVSVLPRRP